jgi:hypothetical protein
MSALPRKTFESLVETYRFWSVFDKGRSAKAERVALEQIAVTLNAATAILLPAIDAVDAHDVSAAHAAWRLMMAIGQDRKSPLALPEVDHVIGALTLWSRLAKVATSKVPAKHTKSARMMVAQRLWSIRYRGFKCSAAKNGAACAELVAIARAAGDKRLTADAACKALSDVHRMRNKLF